MFGRSLRGRHVADHSEGTRRGEDRDVRHVSEALEGS